jgi:(p)ppGpp synthase/HD superfamily hydrolase
VLRAGIFASAAHGIAGNRRKYTGEPYIVHPRNVMTILLSVIDDPEVLAASLLHDTVEDTFVTLGDIDARFGSRVAGLVGMVSDVSKPSDGSRAARKAVDLAYVAAGDADAHDIKLADIIDNLSTISVLDPKFAKVYLREKTAMLSVLTKGHPALLTRAHHTVAEAEAVIYG